MKRDPAKPIRPVVGLLSALLVSGCSQAPGLAPTAQQNDPSSPQTIAKIETLVASHDPQAQAFVDQNAYDNCRVMTADDNGLFDPNSPEMMNAAAQLFADADAYKTMGDRKAAQRVLALIAAHGPSDDQATAVTMLATLSHGAESSPFTAYCAP